MKLLIDTHAAIWWLAGDRRLSATARAAIAQAGVEAVVSVASVWEASIKRSAGRLKGPDLAVALSAAGLPFLHIDERHAKAAGELPLLHRDPFDRMLVAQASIERLAIVTGDEQISKYDVSVLW
ncbi:MAG TPA: type II toxin-antitoxin system VapC family toxin [Solirubrobacteraceae bacterium]|nr:type II toxin-antitoxin system VapC family toxin [Solirubrobacteraceae bacterium]